MNAAASVAPASSDAEFEEVAAAAAAVYSNRLAGDQAADSPPTSCELLAIDEHGRRPLSLSEVHEASSRVFRPSNEGDPYNTTRAGEFVFNPSSEPVVEHPNGRNGRVYPRLRRNQSLGGEVLAMGHRLARHPGVQAIIMDDISQHYGGRRRGSLPPSEGHERGLAHLVDMLDPEDELLQVRDWSGDSGMMMLLEGSGDAGRFPLPDAHVAPRYSRDLGCAMESSREAWPHSEAKTESDLTLLPRCTCRSCNNLAEGEAIGTSTSCWDDVLKKFECGICFDALIGVHVLDNCGHHFCGGCMERWMVNTLQGECPVCREPVSKLVPVRLLDELAEKAVEAAAPGRERSSWFKRRDDWNRNVRLRQEAADRSKAAIEAAMVAQTARASAASAAADAGARRSAVPRAHPILFGQWGADRGRDGAGRREGSHGNQDDSDDNDTFENDGEPNLTVVQLALAVAIVIIVTAVRMRLFR